MQDNQKLLSPWLVAVWPGMGHVAISAGFYLMSKLGMHLIAELDARELFDVDEVEVQRGVIRTGRLPRSRFFVWTDPQRRHDIVVFIGEAQPPLGKFLFCQRLIQFARGLGVERVFTFAAMATQMHPEQESRVFCAATEPMALAELQKLDLEVLQEGHIGGLNGVLLAAAADSEVPGICLLGEMPHIFAQLPFPGASLAVLKPFTALAGVELDLQELAEQGREVKERLGIVLAEAERRIRQAAPPESPEEDAWGTPEPEEEEPKLSRGSEARIEALFERAAQHRSKAYELKRVLDELGVFPDYEDRFLDLFRKEEP